VHAQQLTARHLGIRQLTGATAVPDWWTPPPPAAAAAAAARMEQEHGAEVLKVNAPHLPFITPFVVDTGHGKRSCVLDLREVSGHVIYIYGVVGHWVSVHTRSCLGTANQSDAWLAG
jgi:hypothetical protein